jgi:hypothetical protein
VQAHWLNDEPLFGEEGLLRPLLEDRGQTHVVLFDEMNLSRPVYYLTRYFYTVDAADSAQSIGLNLAPSLAIGTLNIDDTSRPPSPKVIDRCFLVEVDQISHDHVLRPRGITELASLPVLPCLPRASDRPPPIENNVLKPLLDRFKGCVRENGLRIDFLPSRRTLCDISAALETHKELGEAAEQILSTNALVDRLIASRILVKLAGAVDQVAPVLQALEGFLEEKGAELPRTVQRVKLARLQAKLGFISPWQ